MLPCPRCIVEVWANSPHNPTVASFERSRVYNRQSGAGRMDLRLGWGATSGTRDETCRGLAASIAGTEPATLAIALCAMRPKLAPIRHCAQPRTILWPFRHDLVAGSAVVRMATNRRVPEVSDHILFEWPCARPCEGETTVHALRPRQTSPSRILTDLHLLLLICPGALSFQLRLLIPEPTAQEVEFRFASGQCTSVLLELFPHPLQLGLAGGRCASMLFELLPQPFDFRFSGRRHAHCLLELLLQSLHLRVEGRGRACALFQLLAQPFQLRVASGCRAGAILELGAQQLYLLLEGSCSVRTLTQLLARGLRLLSFDAQLFQLRLESRCPVRCGVRRCANTRHSEQRPQ
mmetsp:Transcript_70078/g.194810  ORF Transcript_70078/g.194810 Transcript_70078/m.194810 type:complete len:349 (+) Transcript_70078:424-1470(+)